METLMATIPSTGETLPRMGLGTYKTFDVPQENESSLEEVIKTFRVLGGRIVDSSPMYGRAEKVVGDVSIKTKLNQELFMCTKVWTHGKKEGLKQIKDSIKKMGREKIELMQIHNLIDWKIHLATLRELKEEGIVKYIGITHYTPSAFDELERILKVEKLDFLQIPYNIRENSAERFLIPMAQDKGVAIIANEPFDHGSLFKIFRNKSMPAWSRDYGIESWSQYFLKYILANDRVTFIIPATKDPEHLKENMAAATGQIPEEDFRYRMRKELF